MKAHAATATPPSPIPALLSRLNDKYFPRMPLAPERGRVVARFFRSRLTSAFQPVVRAADRLTVGYQGLVRVRGATGDPAAPWTLFAGDLEVPELVQLDRLCRTLHAVNFFPAGHSGALFLNVDSRLLTGVGADHGSYFEAILALLGVRPERVVIVMPADAVDNPVAFVRSAISYRVRGFRVLVPLAAGDGDLSHLFLADPHFVSVDFPDAIEREPRSLVEALRARGIRPVARRIEDERQARAAQDAGFELLQGFHMGRP